LLDANKLERSDVTVFALQAKLDDLPHAFHQGVQILGLSVAAAKGGDRRDEIALLVAFDNNRELLLRLHVNLQICSSLPRRGARTGNSARERLRESVILKRSIHAPAWGSPRFVRK